MRLALNFLGHHREMILVFLSWVLVGVYGSVVIYALLPLSLVVLKLRSRYQVLFVGFWFIIILSDSRNIFLEFAKTLKPLYALAMALFVMTDRYSFRPMDRTIQYFIPFFAWAFLCLLNSDEHVLDYFQRTLSYVLVIIVGTNITYKYFREGNVEFFRRIIYFAVTLLVVGFVFRYTKPNLATEAGRLNGVFGNPNGLGVFTALLYSFFEVIKMIWPRAFKFREQVLIYACIAAALFWSGSRGSVFGAGIFMLFRYAVKISPFLSFLLVAALALGYQVLEQNLVSIIYFFGLEGYFRVDSLTSGSGRLIGWQYAWDKIQDNFFMGRGIGHNVWVFRKSFHELAALGHQGNAHNSYLTFWLDTGLVGLVTYMGALVMVFFKAAKRNPVALPILFSVLFMINVESWLCASLNPYTIMVFMMLTLLLHYDPNEGPPDPQDEEDDQEPEPPPKPFALRQPKPEPLD